MPLILYVYPILAMTLLSAREESQKTAAPKEMEQLTLKLIDVLDDLTARSPSEIIDYATHHKSVEEMNTMHENEMLKLKTLQKQNSSSGSGSGTSRGVGKKSKSSNKKATSAIMILNQSNNATNSKEVKKKQSVQGMKSSKSSADLLQMVHEWFTALENLLEMHENSPEKVRECDEFWDVLDAITHLNEIDMKIVEKMTEMEQKHWYSILYALLTIHIKLLFNCNDEAQVLALFGERVGYQIGQETLFLAEIERLKE